MNTIEWKTFDGYRERRLDLWDTKSFPASIQDYKDITVLIHREKDNFTDTVSPTMISSDGYHYGRNEKFDYYSVVKLPNK